MKTLVELKEMAEKSYNLNTNKITHTTVNVKDADSFKMFLAYSSEALNSLPALIEEINRLRGDLDWIFTHCVGKQHARSLARYSLEKSFERLP